MVMARPAVAELSRMLVANRTRNRSAAMNDSIDARICRLEGELAKQRQLARGLLVILFGLFSVGVAIGAAATSQDFDVITAKKLVIKDADGRERIRLEAPKAGPSGDAKVAVLAEDGTEVCVMGQYSGSLGIFYTRRYAGDTPGAYLYSSADFAGV